MHVCRAQAVVADWKRFVGRIRNVCCHRQMARLSPRLGAWLSPHVSADGVSKRKDVFGRLVQVFPTILHTTF